MFLLVFKLKKNVMNIDLYLVSFNNSDRRYIDLLDLY